MPQTCIGVVGTAIVAQCTVPKDGLSVPGPGGDPVTGAGLLTMVQSAMDNDATIASGNVTIAGNKTFSGSTVCSGSLSCSTTLGVTGDATLSGDVHIAQTKALVADGTGCTLSGTWSQATSGKVKLLGRKSLWRARTAIPDGNRVVGVGAGAGVDDSGDRFTLPGVTAAKRVIKLKSTTVVPNDAETMYFYIVPVGLFIDGAGVAFEFQREDASVIARIYWDVIGVGGQVAYDHLWCEFEFTGGAWVLSGSIGSMTDAGTSTKFVGVRLA